MRLPQHYEEAYTRAKAELVLSKKAQAFKPPQVKWRNQSGPKGAPPAKKAKGDGARSGGKDQQGSSHQGRSGKHSRKGKGQNRGNNKGQSKGPPSDKGSKGS